jgi:hypothetical protein
MRADYGHAKNLVLLRTNSKRYCGYTCKCGGLTEFRMGLKKPNGSASNTCSY